MAPPSLSAESSRAEAPDVEWVAYFDALARFVADADAAICAGQPAPPPPGRASRPGGALPSGHRERLAKLTAATAAVIGRAEGRRDELATRLAVLARRERAERRRPARVAVEL